MPAGYLKLRRRHHHVRVAVDRNIRSPEFDYSQVIVDTAPLAAGIEIRQHVFSEGQPLISVLIPTVAGRENLCTRLLEYLFEQSNFNYEIVIARDDGTIPSGIKRQRLLETATGRYICFADDDDLVSTDYLSSLCTAAATGVDVVTFELQRSWPGRPSTFWSFGMRNTDHLKDRGATANPIQMSANHLCAWRRELALSVPFSPIGYADDVFWYKPLLASGLCRTTRHIPRILYHYLYDPAATINQKEENRRRSIDWAADGVEAWRHSATGGIGVSVYDRGWQPKNPMLPVRFTSGVKVIPRQQLQRLLVVTI